MCLLFYYKNLTIDFYFAIIGSIFLLTGLIIGYKYKSKPEKIEHIIPKSKLQVESNNPDFLTVREQEVLQLLNRGLSNQDLAKELFLSVNTVKTHLSNLYSKLNVNNRTQAIIKAKELNLMD